MEEGNDRYSIGMRSDDGKTELNVNAKLANSFPTHSMFESIEHASSCFENCPVGISPSIIPERMKIIRLQTKSWNVKPLEVQTLKSSFFEDKTLFSDGTIEFDNALLMQGIEHEWLSDRGPVSC